MRPILPVLAFVLARCVAPFVPAPLTSNAVTGDAVVARGAEESRFTIDRCAAGEHEMFYGFDLGSSADPKIGIRAVVDPIWGPAVRVTTASGEYVVRTRDCETLRVDVQPTGWRVNEVRDFAGSVAMDGRTGDAHLRANVRISACH